MKCDDCLNLLEAYLDREANERETEQVKSHLATCANCAHAFEILTAENEIFARYDRELEISSATWNGIAARIALEDRQNAAKSRFSLSEWFAGLFATPSFRFAMPAVALVLIAMLVGLAYWRTRPQGPPKDQIARNTNVAPRTAEVVAPTPAETPNRESDGNKGSQRSVAPKMVPATDRKSRGGNQPEVLDRDSAYSDIEERDTADHLEQAQNLLLSFRDIKYSDTDEEIDVSYEKAESRRLLSENILLRRDAEDSGNFPAKAMLGSLEPFLIDIANLPDKAKPSDVRQINDRVQKTDIVAELRGY